MDRVDFNLAVSLEIMKKSIFCFLREGSKIKMNKNAVNADNKSLYVVAYFDSLSAFFAFIYQSSASWRLIIEHCY